MKPIVPHFAMALLVLQADMAYAATGGSVFAANNPEGRYEDGIFRLPQLADPRDKYVLILTVDDKQKPAIALPAGATGIVFGANSAPSGNWSWAFALQREDLPELEVATSDNLAVPAGVLTAYSGRLFLEWEKAPNATSYRVEIAPWTDAKGNKKAEWGDSKKIVTRCDEPELKTRCNVDFEAETGKRYKWSVTAISDTKVDIARSVPRTIQTADTVFSGMTNSGWSLQRSDSGSDDDKKAALFSYARALDSQGENVSSYSAALAVIWQPQAGFSSTLFPRLSSETRRTSSGKEKENDATILRAGVYGTHTMPSADGARTGYNWTASAKYEQAQKDGTRKGLMEFRMTPFFGPLGRYWNVPSVGEDGRDSANNIRPDRFPVMQLMPVLSISVEIGKTFEVGSSAETQDRIKRLRADLRFDMLWPRLSNSLGVLSVTSYAGGTYWRLVGQGDEHHLGQAGLSIGLSPEISLDLAYKVGEEAPNFKFGRTTNLGLGIKF